MTSSHDGLNNKGLTINMQSVSQYPIQTKKAFRTSKATKNKSMLGKPLKQYGN